MMDTTYLRGDTVVQCPYDSNHKVTRSRLQMHLVKCEKNFPEDFRRICPYNATHRLPKAEMLAHVNDCPARQFAQPELYHTYRNFGSIKSLPPSEIDIDECWEEDDRTISEVESNACFNNSTSFVSKYERFDDLPLRGPKGQAEVDMLDSSIGSSALDEMGSVISADGMGRGSAKFNREKFLQQIGRGRGKPIQF
ncbi:gametocyte-specific factor 1-like [Leptopilina heterotoma]|uniref:gametocyte-specific factor 1-like n=1 Tax=Leptopilina heterotoma TaxID=63436 RepID=UPI001CA9295C|nr:gametocyte-specific factor 1-like [Leptopilina heterotoma]